MRIWEHTFGELTGGKQPLSADDGPLVEQPFILATIVPITHNPRYATALIRGGDSFANQALLELREGQWTCVGSYVDDTIHLDASVRGLGLAEELVLRCAEHRHVIPFTTNFSSKGYSLLKRTHRLAVERALKAKLWVPDAVLAEYPDLRAN